MHRPLRQRIQANYAAVTSTLALFVALGGTGYAAANITSDKIQDDAVLSRHVLDDQISSADVRDAVPADNGINFMVGGLTTADLSDRLITNPKLAENSVSGSKVRELAIGARHLASGSVGGHHLLAAAVRGGAQGAVLDESIDDNDLAASSVGTSEIADGSIGGADVANNAIRNEHLGTVSLDKVDIWFSDARRTAVISDDSSVDHVDAECDRGGVLIGGGYEVHDRDAEGEAVVSESRAVFTGTAKSNDGTNNFWRVGVALDNILGDVDSDDSATVTAIAHCMYAREDAPAGSR